MSEMFYKLAGQTLRVEYEHYEPDEGQPVESIDVERIEDLAGNPVSVSTADGFRIAGAARRHQYARNRQDWTEFRDRALRRRTAAGESSPSQKLITLPRA